MTCAPRTALMLAVAAATFVSACSPKRIVTPVGAPGQSVIALLPDENGSTGRASLFNESGSADLAATRDVSVTVVGQRPGDVHTLSEAEVTELFGEALSALPPPPRHFTLNFRFESDELTEESRALVPAVLAAVRHRAVPEVAVIGHTDTLGSPNANIELGMKRAMMVRNLLITAGLKPSFVEVTSHGEADLLVRTPDETPEPRNRRVEISVR